MHHRARDITGQRSHYLTAIAYVGSDGKKSLWKVQCEFRKLLRRYVSNVLQRFVARQNRCKWRLLQGKLPVGVGQGASSKQASECNDQFAVGADHCCRGIRKIGNRMHDTFLPDTARLPGRFTVCETGCNKPVYDIKNVGKLHRFTVLSSDGLMIVHNCVQAIARDCLAVNIRRLEQTGYPVVFHVHDEVVIEMDPQEGALDDITEIMSQPIDWAPGLPLKAEGWVGDYFTKD